jgi:hypothetical protein
VDLLGQVQRPVSRRHRLLGGLLDLAGCGLQQRHHDRYRHVPPWFGLRQPAHRVERLAGISRCA